MARLALPSQAFSDVQRFMKQKRAVGQQVTPSEERSAWQAYWDVTAARQHEAERIGLEHERIGLSKEQLEIQEEQIGKQQRAATISGIGQLAGTAALGVHVLKGTKLGGKIGLGVSEAGAGTIPAIAPTTGQVSAMGAGYGPVTSEFAAAQGFGAAAPAVGESAVAGTAITGMGASLATGASALGPGLVGAGVGMGAKALIPGDKPVVEAAVGAAAGVAAGAGTAMAMGATIGSAVPVVGTAAGTIIGGISGFVGASK